jgi:glycosyltransferase involved in cell wall biosynthesis
MENKDFPLVSIIIPCRNEGKYIGKCLDSIIAQDYPKDKFEILVVDGRSDKTKENVATT